MRDAKLKAAIYESGKTSKQVAMEAGIHPSYLSMATSGRYILDQTQKKAVAKVLRKSVAELFGKKGG